MTPKVKRITGILYPTANAQLLDWSINELVKIWGAVELKSEPVPFDRTDYYNDIDPDLSRVFLCFEGLHNPQGLTDWKHQAIAIEAQSRKPVRSVNIDPGYIDGARLVLASTKDHAHRIYLRDGIFGEVTMRYKFKKWTAFDYTFPDFASGVYDKFLSGVRTLWLREARNA